jgi:hypothetical protein
MSSDYASQASLSMRRLTTLSVSGLYSVDNWMSNEYGTVVGMRNDPGNQILK